MDGEQPNNQKSKRLIYVAVVVFLLLIGYVIISALRRPGLVSPLADEEGEGVRVIFVSPQPSESPEATTSATPEASATTAPKATPKASPSATPKASPTATPTASSSTSPNPSPTGE